MCGAGAKPSPPGDPPSADPKGASCRGGGGVDRHATLGDTRFSVHSGDLGPMGPRPDAKEHRSNRFLRLQLAGFLKG